MGVRSAIKLPVAVQLYWVEEQLYSCHWLYRCNGCETSCKAASGCTAVLGVREAIKLPVAVHLYCVRAAVKVPVALKLY